MELQTMKKASVLRRIAAFYIDAVIISLIVLAPLFSNFYAFIENPDRLFFYSSIMMIVAIIGFYMKDIVNGVSLGKWILSIQVRDSNDLGNKPSFARLIYRNILIIVWPVEAFALLISKNRRKIGDKLAKTDVYVAQDKVKVIRVILSVILLFILFISVILFTATSAIKNNISYKQAIRTIEESNEIQVLTGGIIGYGAFPSSNISITNGYGKAEITITVKGKQKDLKVYVYLEKELQRDWVVSEISY